MNLHLVGGFLGSGKTTAIGAAARLLSASGAKACAIMNDQGSLLVDTHYLKELGIPNGEVTGGCFCCNYAQLVSEIDRLYASERPSAIFAESVGSCTDLIATVLKPLLQSGKQHIGRITFSTFVDARLLLRWLRGEPLPFDDDTNYIWEKQLEEAVILVVNKIDLLEEADAEFIRREVREYAKAFVFQNSLRDADILKWTEALDTAPVSGKPESLEIDYARYGAGEANLAWMDELIEVTTKDFSAARMARQFVEDLIRGLRSRRIAIGHLKFLLHTEKGWHKFGFTSLPDSSFAPAWEREECSRISLRLNARVQMSPEDLRSMVQELLEVHAGNGREIVERNISFFQPGFPQPTYRLP